MGSLAGHVAPGIGFLIIGLWHLFNHVKLHTTHSLSYSAPAWFPVPKLRYAEPLFIVAGTTASIVTELFISPHRHQPLDLDMTIPTNHLHTFEHASISLALLLHGALSIAIDRFSPEKLNSKPMSFFVASVALAQELLLFRLHSTDHTGPEGQYHFFLQLIIAVSLVTALMGMGFSDSFMVSFVRSMSIVMQGVWFIVAGIMLWTPELLPKGCFLKDVDGRKVATCAQESLHRAKSLINLEFSWYLTATTAFGVFFYFAVAKMYSGRKVEYYSLLPRDGDVESQKKKALI